MTSATSAEATIAAMMNVARTRVHARENVGCRVAHEQRAGDHDQGDLEGEAERAEIERIRRDAEVVAERGFGIDEAEAAISEQAHAQENELRGDKQAHREEYGGQHHDAPTNAHVQPDPVLADARARMA